MVNSCRNCNKNLTFKAFFACELFPFKCKNCGFVYYRKYRTVGWVSFISLLLSPLFLVLYSIDSLFVILGMVFLVSMSVLMDVKLSPLIFISQEDYRIKNRRKDKKLLLFILVTAVLFYLIENGYIG
ncbi:hypothetical protein N483_27450 [Pseudoalteromonas luteoviolacea NCIMB 1944]|uniref:Cxxc_20_cxxc protein n=1 Tax=Pseudoalteromonas luteoviolacea (strain 2ta16) TaxID=1353533 RepID=V4HUS1_PSEL2|nr:hypothetical protein PL2TA16_00074 [Pseudoalteromonas luteoviolacea 2ta16]KZN29665.1 hypothetical protein N483_27450 [Pseudoalteromonas luteoviolacea NCIMB 1944]